MHILILLIINLLIKKHKCKYKIKQIKLFYKDIKLQNILKIKKMLKKNMGFLYIKVVLYQEILSEL